MAEYKALYEKERTMRVAGFMSGSGTNLIKNIEHSLEKGSNHEFVIIFTDTEDESKCKAKEIAFKYGLPLEVIDITKFCNSKGYKRKIDAPMSVREQYDSDVADLLKKYNVDCVALCGYMSIVTRKLIDKYGLTINVHPADLSVKDDNGNRKYVGMHAVRDAILNGEKFIHSTTHIVREKVDGGEILMVSKPVEVELPENVNVAILRRLFENSKASAEDAARLKEIVDVNQDRLKRFGDWVIYPLTLKLIASGRFGVGRDGVAYLDGIPVKDGYRVQ